MDTTHPNGACSEDAPCISCAAAYAAPMRGDDEPRILHCWKDYREHLADVHGWGTGEESRNATCMLEAGHEGLHEFTPDTEIGVAFSEASDV